MNKYAIFYNINKLNFVKNNIDIYNDLLYHLYMNDRDYDIFVDIDTYCYTLFSKNILSKINLNFLKNIKFNIISDCNIIDTYRNMFNNIHNYDIIAYHNCCYKCGLKYFDLLKDYPYGIYTQSFINNCDNKEYLSGGNENYINFSFIYLKKDNIKTNITKILKCIYNYPIIGYPDNDILDKKIINNILYKDILLNNICYISNNLNNNMNYMSDFHIINIKDYNKYYWLDDSYNNITIEKINDIPDIKINNYVQNVVKYNNLLIRKYMLGYTDNFNPIEYRI